MRLLDEIATAPVNWVQNCMRSSPDFFSGRVGPMVEYEFFRRGSRHELPPLNAHADTPLIRRIVQSFDDRSARDLDLKPRPADITGVPANLSQDAGWVAFVKRSDLTARSAGFSPDVAGGFAGAIQEMADNIIQHSEATNTGIAAFARTSDGFEYVVGDLGIGILASLRKAREFRSLRDDLEALPLAVTSGVSRHGRGVGYGYGFRAVVLPLRAANGTVRLRSGSAALEMEGDGPNQDRGRCFQRAFHQGVVVSVTVRHQ